MDLRRRIAFFERRTHPASTGAEAPLVGTHRAGARLGGKQWKGSAAEDDLVFGPGGGQVGKDGVFEALAYGEAFEGVFVPSER